MKMVQPSYLRDKLPPILVSVSTFATCICILIAIFFPWYQVQISPDGNCKTIRYYHLFYTYDSCGTCNIAQCLTISKDGGGLNVDWQVVVNAVAWALSILSFLCLILGSLFSWVPMFVALRWLARFLLTASAFLILTAFMVYLSYNSAIAESYWTLNGDYCNSGPCKSFVGHNDETTGYSYWGPSVGWICSVIVTFFIIIAAVISCTLDAPSSDSSSYDSITTYD